MKKIAFQGELGAYSHLACIEAAPDHNPVACRTFESAMEQVNASECHLAMIPIENSVAGRVADIHYLLGGYDLKIYSENAPETLTPIPFVFRQICPFPARQLRQ